MRLLEVVGLTKRFGPATALDAASFTVEEGEIVGLVGPAGSGKTTCLSCLSGVVVPDGGRVIFDGRDITGERPGRVARAGVGHAGALPMGFRWLTVRDAVALARGPGRSRGIAASWPRPVGRRTAQALLQRVGLEAAAGRRVGALAPGVRRRLEVARALGAAPRLLLLDAPLNGLSPQEACGLADLIAGLRMDGLTVVLAERDLAAAPTLVDRVVTLHRGTVVTRRQSKA
jgi:branched-chain amino acid transport system ATP-binding protein